MANGVPLSLKYEGPCWHAGLDGRSIFPTGVRRNYVVLDRDLRCSNALGAGQKAETALPFRRACRIDDEFVGSTGHSIGCDKESIVVAESEICDELSAGWWRQWRPDRRVRRKIEELDVGVASRRGSRRIGDDCIVARKCGHARRGQIDRSHAIGSRQAIEAPGCVVVGRRQADEETFVSRNKRGRDE